MEGNISIASFKKKKKKKKIVQSIMSMYQSKKAWTQMNKHM